MQKIYRLCVGCKKWFSVENNHDRICTYHIKPLITQSGDGWSGTSGYSCCGKPSNSKGCVTSAHVPRPLAQAHLEHLKSFYPRVWCEQFFKQNNYYFAYYHV